MWAEFLEEESLPLFYLLIKILSFSMPFLCRFLCFVCHKISVAYADLDLMVIQADLELMVLLHLLPKWNCRCNYTCLMDWVLNSVKLYLWEELLCGSRTQFSHCFILSKCFRVVFFCEYMPFVNCWLSSGAESIFSSFYWIAALGFRQIRE